MTVQDLDALDTGALRSWSVEVTACR